MMLCEFLIEAHVSLGIIVGEDRANATKKHGDPLMTACETVIKILENGEVLTMLLQSLEGLRNIIGFTGLSRIREKGFLVDPIVVGETDKALDRFTFSGGSASDRNHRLKQGD
jgi:hypothetical protein